MSNSWNGNGYRSGRHYVECDRCGLRFTDDQVKKEWTGLIVCIPCWEARHPQDFVRARKDRISATGLVRPESTDQFVSGPCATYTSTPGRAIPGCAIPGREDDSIASIQVPQGTFDLGL